MGKNVLPFIRYHSRSSAGYFLLSWQLILISDRVSHKRPSLRVFARYDDKDIEKQTPLVPFPLLAIVPRVRADPAKLD